MKQPKLKVGVVVGRFQTPLLTEGHLHLLSYMCERSQTNVVFIGVHSSQPTKRNPLDYATRKRMVEGMYKGINVFPLHDQHSDELWSKNLDDKIEEEFSDELCEVTLYGSRDSFISNYHGRYKTVEVECVQCHSSTELREKTGQYPLDSPLFRAGVIYGAHKRFPSPYLCVDVTVIKDGKFLFCKKPGEDKLRFIGGFVDSKDDGITATAIRELWEEAQVVGKTFTLIGEAKINDWRYVKDEENIFTNLFVFTYAGGACVAGDDISELHWLKISELLEKDFMPQHHILLELLLKHIDKCTTI